MTPSHHVPEEQLMAYAAGALPESIALLVATHCALCPHCRAAVEGLEDVGSALLEDGPGDPLAEGAVDSLLARLDQPRPQPEPLPPTDGVIPMPLRQYTGPLSQVTFRRALPQVQQFDLPILHGNRPVQLVRLEPGFTVPDHHHDGVERTLVLAGGFTDNYGQYGPGDLSVREEGVHLQRIDDGEPCIALLVNDGRLQPTTLMGKLAGWLTGL